MLAITEFSKGTIGSAPAQFGSAHDGSDEALVEAIAAGDRHAMRTLYARHHVRVYRFILRMTNDASLAEDIVSEAFIGAWRQAGGFKSKSQVSTWLLAIARNRTLSALSRRRDEQLDDDVANSVEDPASDAETGMEIQDRDAIIRKCLSQLSSDHRQVIDLVYYHEKTVEEVADIIQVPRSTVKTRMFYARKCMAKLLTASGCNLH
jgi:RNA polymerase sigma-70 factor, ECF subfamily